MNSSSLDLLLMTTPAASFPSSLVSPSILNTVHHISNDNLPITKLSFESTQNFLLKILDECLSIIEDISFTINSTLNRGPGVTSSSIFPTYIPIKIPLHKSSLKILNVSPLSAEQVIFSSDAETQDSGKIIENILVLRLSSTAAHIKRLKLRLLDHTVRILVTGDVNAGKSTLVNSLLEIPGLLPTDQQPCTCGYCEVVLDERQSSFQDDANVVHAIPKLELYDAKNENTFQIISLSEMQRLSSCNMDDLNDGEYQFAWFRIFLSSETLKRDGHSSSPETLPFSCSLIDSPGLNHNTVQTMSLFAKQDDIDILIFVVNAANHLTLSASEFLVEAAKEKEKIFIIVNKFDDIKDKQKCKRIVMQQIANLLPCTFSDSERLVHFISAKDPADESFIEFRKSLVNWASAPELRAKTKLSPPATLSSAILNDVLYLLLYNLSFLESEIHRIQTYSSKEAPLEEKFTKNIPLLTNPLFLGEEGEVAARAALSSSLEQLGALVDGEGLLISARLIQTIDGHQWPGSFSFFSIPAWIKAFAGSLGSVALAQLAICRSIAISKGSEGISRINSKVIQTLPELFDSRMGFEGKSEDASGSFEFCSDPNYECNSTSAFDHKHTPDLSAFNISGWGILLDLRSEVYNFTTYLGTFGLLSGITTLVVRIGVSNVIGTVSTAYFKYGQYPAAPYNSSGNSSQRFFPNSATLFLSTAAIAIIAICAISARKDGAIDQSTSKRIHAPGRFEAHLREKIAKKIIHRLQETKWKEFESAAIATIARDSTNSTILNIQTKFQLRLTALTKRKAAREQYIVLLEDRYAYFKSLQRKCNLLMTELESHSLHI